MTNPTLDLLMQRRSIRKFTSDPIPDSDLELILQATQQSPTSLNAQGISLIVIKDPERIKKIAEMSGGQPQIAGAKVFVVFVVDFHRTEVACQLQGKQHRGSEDVDKLLVGAVDAGIAVTSFQTAAHALGYGTTVIGGIRHDPAKLIEFLELPPNTFPIIASTLGVPDPDAMPKVKPRVEFSSYVMDDRYNSQAVTDGTTKYESTLRTWLDEQGSTQMPGYSDMVAPFYSSAPNQNVLDALHAQGFITGLDTK